MVPPLVEDRLGADGRGRRHGCLGLLELGMKFGVVQTYEDVTGLHFLARLQIDFDDPCQQIRANGRLVYGANRADCGFKNGQPNHLNSRDRTFDGRSRTLV